MIGPNTLITTVNHPLSPKGRRARLSQVKPVTIGNDVWIGGNCTLLPGVTIGNNVWLGGNVVICPGVTIGDNSIIGAGAVVTHDIPADSIAVGNPCHVIAEVPDDWTPEERAAAEGR